MQSGYAGLILCRGATRPVTTFPNLRSSKPANTLLLECSFREQVVAGHPHWGRRQLQDRDPAREPRPPWATHHCDGDGLRSWTERTGAG